MKTLLTIIAISFIGFLASVAFAEDKGADFAKHKQEMVEHFDKKIANLTEVKNCVNSAQNHDDLKKCHEKMKEERLKGREEMMERRKERIDSKIKKLEEEKAKMNSEKK